MKKIISQGNDIFLDEATLRDMMLDNIFLEPMSAFGCPAGCDPGERHWRFRERLCNMPTINGQYIYPEVNVMGKKKLNVKS